MNTELPSESSDARSQSRLYALAILAAVLALIVRQLLLPLLGESNPYHTVWAAVVFSAWYCGFWPAALTTVLSLVGVWYWFLPPTHSFFLEDPKTAVSGMVGFILFSGLIIALAQANRRSLTKRIWAEQQLQQAHDELEKKVAERTAELNLANENLRELSSRLQQLRDDERRQIARELHDSVGQMLAALSMNLETVSAQVHKLDEGAARAVSDSRALIGQISSEIRTISHLLHPPLLDVAGLASALRWYVDGFSERSKIKVELHIEEELGRLSDEMEIAIFRMIQECLTNIHRHSGSSRAVIRVGKKDGRIVVEVQDEGTGMTEEKQRALKASGPMGVGFRGLRERLRQLGGNLEIESGSSGTAVTAVLPIPPASADKA